MNVASPFAPREKFLVLEVMPSGVNGLFMHVDENHELVFEKLERGMELAKFFRKPWRRATQQAWEGEYLFKNHRKVIAVAGPTLATTIPIPISLAREAADAKHEITVPELENLIAQEMAKIFNTCRTEAAARLGLHELDTVLVAEKARYVEVDGNSVMNPEGFAGKKVTLLLELTFAGRELFETLAPFFNAPEDFYFAESPQSRLTAIARVRKLPVAMVSADGAGSSLFVLAKGDAKHEYPVLYREPFAWGFGPLFGRVMTELGVSRTAAEGLYELYLKGGFSEAAARAFKRMIDPAIAELLAEIDAHTLKGTLIMDAPYGLPLGLPYRHGDVVIDAMPQAEVMKGLGFTQVIGAAISEYELSRHLLPFLEAYFDKSNTDLNQKLRRRLHWLAL
jgi:hypothetical protein